MKRILVPVDFSPTSKKALRYAVDIASRSGGTIMLYHLYKPGKAGSVGVPKDVHAYNQQMEINNLKRLQRLKKKVLEDAKEEITISTIIGKGPVVSNVLRFAESNHIDLIVMGTQGASGLKKITVGSNAANVMKKSEVPVLLIPEKFEWKRPKEILFTTVLSKSDNEAFSVLSAFANLYKAQITFVNFRSVQELAGFNGKEEFEMYSFSVQRILDYPNIQFRQLNTFSVAESMENLYKEIPYDLLVMARRKLDFAGRFLQKSFTKKMAHVTRQPLLVIPEK